jgi:RiboL-PSP-HEPN
MARYTAAYSSLLDRLTEVDLLLRLATRQERLNPIKLRHSINALCRGAIVLLSSHLEGFIKELGEIILERLETRGVPRSSLAPQFFFHLSKDILDEIKNTSEPESIANKVFNMLSRDYDLWSQSGLFPRSLPVELFNKDFSNPAFKKVKAYFNRFGYANYQTDLARILTANNQATINMVNHLVDVRNKIAHGDMSTAKTPADVVAMATIVRNFCATSDRVFAQWCKTTLCAIR